jgi:hypothetical protein
VGFVSGLLSTITDSAKPPGITCPSGNHACFGYRILKGLFKELEESFERVEALCDAAQLPCLGSDAPTGLNPNQVPTQPTQSTFVPPSPFGTSSKTMITSWDWVGSDNEEEVLARVIQESVETHAREGTSIRRDHSPSSHPTGHSWFAAPTQQSRLNKRLRSPSIGENSVPILFPICIFQYTHQPTANNHRHSHCDRECQELKKISHGNLIQVMAQDDLVK